MAKAGTHRAAIQGVGLLAVGVQSVGLSVPVPVGLWLMGYSGWPMGGATTVVADRYSGLGCWILPGDSGTVGRLWEALCDCVAGWSSGSPCGRWLGSCCAAGHCGGGVQWVTVAVWGWNGLL